MLVAVRGEWRLAHNATFAGDAERPAAQRGR